MPRIVQKFGGTSVADLERIRNAALRVKREADAGNEIAVVVSAMAGTTNQLVGWTRQMSRLHDAREYDVVVSSGGQVTAGLMAMALQDLGLNARSWLGWQVPIRTDGVHSKARIEAIETAELERRFAEGQISVVAGFQGIGPRGRVTTLGRGGSDTSAVAVAAALGAERCDIYTDVDGVYTTDPRIVSKAQRMDRIAHEEMLEMASLGAKVLQVRSVELAMVHKVRTYVRSSFDDPANPQAGTLICDEEEIVEQQIVTGIAYSRDEAQLTLRRVAAKPGATAILGRLRDEIGYASLQGATDLVKVSAIGIGMRSHAGVAARAFKALAEKGINIRAITTSEIKFSLLIDANYTELAVRTLHSLYDLDK